MDKLGSDPRHLGERATAAVRPVGGFGCAVGFRARLGGVFGARAIDAVWFRGVVGAISAVADIGTDRAEALARHGGCSRFDGGVVYVDLMGAGDGEDAGTSRRPNVSLPSLSASSPGVRCDPPHDVGGVFVSTELGAPGLPLLGGGPVAGGVAAFEGEGVGAGVVARLTLSAWVMSSMDHLPRFARSDPAEVARAVRPWPSSRGVGQPVSRRSRMGPNGLDADGGRSRHGGSQDLAVGMERRCRPRLEWRGRLATVAE